MSRHESAAVPAGVAQPSTPQSTPTAPQNSAHLSRLGLRRCQLLLRAPLVLALLVDGDLQLRHLLAAPLVALLLAAKLRVEAGRGGRRRGCV